MDVGVLSYRMTFQSVSAWLPNGLCFFHLPRPAVLSARLAARFPPPKPSGHRRPTGFPRST